MLKAIQLPAEVIFGGGDWAVVPADNPTYITEGDGYVPAGTMGHNAVSPSQFRHGTSEQMVFDTREELVSAFAAADLTIDSEGNVGTPEERDVQRWNGELPGLDFETDEYQQKYLDWQDMNCSCHICAPCARCFIGPVNAF